MIAALLIGVLIGLLVGYIAGLYVADSDDGQDSGV